LIAARKRSVEIYIKTNAIRESDHSLPSVAFKQIVPDLVAAGAHIFSNSTPNFLHEKMMIVDQSSVYIGSANFDPRSKNLNSESGVIVSNSDLGAKAFTYYRAEMTDFNVWGTAALCRNIFSGGDTYMTNGYKLGAQPTFKESLSERVTTFMLPLVRGMY